MVLTLKVLNSDATLNNWEDQGGSAQVVRGADSSLILQFVQVDRGIRYIPASGATTSLALLNSDQSVLTLSGSFPFADDRSIVQFSISAAQTANLISQNLVVTLVEGLSTNIAVLPLALQVISPSQVGC